MSVCYYVLNWLQNYESGNDTFSTSLVVCKHAIYYKEDKILINNLFELKGYNARRLVRVSQKKLKCQQCLQVVAATGMGYWLVDRHPSSGR